MKTVFATIWGLILLGSTELWAEVVHLEGDMAAAPHHAAQQHGGGSEGLPQFDPTSFPSQIFWLLIAFAFLYIFFSRKTLPEISSVIEGRQEHIQSDLNTAENLKLEADKAHADYDAMMDKARAESSAEFAKADQDSKDKTTARYAAFYERSVKELKEAEKAIEQAKTEAMDDMNALAAEVAAQAAEKIIGVQTDIKQAQTVVDSLQSKRAKAA